ncbi:MAG: PTS sugar transporter subunit IIB, partial [Gemmatimonadota bacterium]|nr:PTS sugar transporter subunit IIB [Gemmatimonadota bacterium]
MTIALYRIDDRLIHGQVVVGWGQPLELRFIILVDDVVAASDWEQELYRMGVPPEMEVQFCNVESASRHLENFLTDSRTGIVLVGDIGTMQRLVTANPEIRSVNVGGVHHAPGRTAKLRYVFLTPDEEQGLRAIQASG